MKKEWEYLGKKYVIHDDDDGNYYLNGHLCDCKGILLKLEKANKTVAGWAKYKAKEMVDEMEGVVDMSDGAVMERVRREFSKFKSKEWEYDHRQYIAHYDAQTSKLYLNGHLCKHYDIWLNVDSPDEMVSWRAKHKAKEIENERLETDGVKVYFRCKQTLVEKMVFWGIGAAIFIFIVYLIYKIWWFFVGYSAFEGPLAQWYSASEVFWDSIIFIIVFVVVIEEVVRRIVNGHF